MNQNFNFIENSIFLSEHAAINKFVTSYFHSMSSSGSKENFVILCERKEDIVCIRNQIFIEIEKQFNQKISYLTGLSIYSIDTLAQKICISLNHFKNEFGLNSNLETLLKPFLDIPSQEKIVELILNLFGYVASDSLPLAKQILTLIDIPLPEDVKLLDLIIETQQSRGSKTIQNIEEKSLRQILATIQQSQIEFSQYARFQVLVAECLNGDFEIKNKLLPKDILHSNLLWIGAPEYCQDYRINYENINETSPTLKPGNYQKYFVNEFKLFIKKCRLHFGSGIFYDSRTILLTHIEIDNEKCKIILFENGQEYFKQLEEKSKNNSQAEIMLCADFDPNSMPFYHRLGYGSYPISQKEIMSWNLNKNELIENSSEYIHTIYRFLSSKFKEYIQIISCIQNLEWFNKIGAIYKLNILQLEEKNIFELFMHSMMKEKFNFGEMHELNRFPKVLSFFNTYSSPQKIISMGRPHKSVSQSFNVKILNQVFILLKSKGVDVDIPSSETMYEGFWKNCLRDAKDVEFAILGEEEIKNFPNFLKINNIINSKPTLNYLVPNGLKTENIIPNWRLKFGLENKNISITQFEEYVHCPFKFYLKNILKIENNLSKDELNYSEIGTKMHQICEKFITRFVTVLGNKGYVDSGYKILTAIVEILKNEDLFLTSQKQQWLKPVEQMFHLSKIENSNLLFCAYEESVNLIWNDEIHTETFLQIQQREILKRTFLRFLTTECENLKKNLKVKVGLFREFPIRFQFFGLNLSGRLDRVDLTHCGLEIIDYKTSNISKMNKELVFHTHQAINPQKYLLSIQGALYTYGFSQTLFSEIIEEDEESWVNKIKFYSLYFLKNCLEEKDNCLTMSLEEPFVQDGNLYQSIQENYKPFAQNLISGDFSPKPLQGKTTCMYCEMKTACSKTYEGDSHVKLD